MLRKHLEMKWRVRWYYKLLEIVIVFGIQEQPGKVTDTIENKKELALLCYTEIDDGPQLLTNTEIQKDHSTSFM